MRFRGICALSRWLDRARKAREHGVQNLSVTLESDPDEFLENLRALGGRV